MEHTNNYELSKWAETDRILMEDFNMDHDKIDAAIKAVETSSLKIKTGSYTGTGTSTSIHYTTGAKPRLLLIGSSNDSSNGVTRGLIMSENGIWIRFSYNIVPWMGTSNCPVTLTNNGFTINHSHSFIYNSGPDLNTSSLEYRWWVLY